MRLSKNSISKVSLSDILRRRRKTLPQFLKEFGIVTYELLVARCNSMGVVPPTEEKFALVTGGNPPQVSSPSEGVIIVDVVPQPVHQPITESAQSFEIESQPEPVRAQLDSSQEEQYTLSEISMTMQRGVIEQPHTSHNIKKKKKW